MSDDFLHQIFVGLIITTLGAAIMAALLFWLAA